MVERGMMPNSCVVCDGEAVDITIGDSSFLITCLDCRSYEILELAAKYLQELSLADRRRLLDRARLAAEIQGGPPLIRQPFELS